MRKNLELDIEEEIEVDLDVKDDRVAGLVREHEALIGQEVRAADFGALEDGHRESWTVEGVEMEIAIKPVSEVTT
ncbi:hypothetical protein ACFQJ7_09610 [Halovenus rubra]|uniref:Amphi-Trp domain-containing protein n=1 Tax=Halovenus rubra TaxID=869890 RepID=A0ABD5XD14_9EURY|nr:hypothetical protein [Halovenus rubra]